MFHKYLWAEYEAESQNWFREKLSMTETLLNAYWSYLMLGIHLFLYYVYKSIHFSSFDYTCVNNVGLDRNFLDRTFLTNIENSYGNFPAQTFLHCVFISLFYYLYYICDICYIFISKIIGCDLFLTSIWQHFWYIENSYKEI